MSITYLGNIDDRVAAFPWTNEAVDDQYLKDVLMRAALLHSDLAINDGYLINLEAARNGLFLKDIKRPHPLRELIKANFIKILTRNENKLHELPKAMMRQGVNTFGKTIKGIDWPSLAREFENWFSVESRFGPKWVKWPRKDVGSGFVKLLKMIREEKISSDETKSDIFKYVHDRFETLILNESISGARSKWEKVTTKMLQEGKLSLKDQLRMMHVANEIYQYNFALCLQAEHESDIYVASRFSPLFEEARLDPKEASDNILHIPDLEIPLRLKDLITDGKFLGEVVTPGSSLNKAKLEYLEQRDRFVRGVSTTPRGISEASKQYVSRMLEYFKREKLINDIEFEFSKGMVKLVSSASIGTMVGLASGEGEVAMSVAFFTSLVTSSIDKIVGNTNCNLFEQYYFRKTTSVMSMIK